MLSAPSVGVCWRHLPAGDLNDRLHAVRYLRESAAKLAALWSGKITISRLDLPRPY